MMKWIGIALMMLGLTGCGVAPWQSQGPTPPSRTPFPEDVYKSLPKTGDAQLAGVVMYVDNEGEVHYADKIEVVAAPVTSYSKEAYDALGRNAPVPPADARAQAYTRHARTDGQGFFKMLYLPAGEYFVIGQVKWRKNGIQQHQTVRDQVAIKAHETTYVNLMNP